MVALALDDGGCCHQESAEGAQRKQEVHSGRGKCGGLHRVCAGRWSISSLYYNIVHVR